MTTAIFLIFKKETEVLDSFYEKTFVSIRVVLLLFLLHLVHQERWIPMPREILKLDEIIVSAEASGKNLVINYSRRAKGDIESRSGGRVC